MKPTDLTLIPYLSADQIKKRVSELAREIEKHYKGEPFVAVCVLKGSFMFYSDLTRELSNCDMECEFLSVSSYAGTESTGEVKIHLDLGHSIANKHVLLIEDIVDTGLTMVFLRNWLQQRHPKSLKLATLLFKPDSLKTKIDLDFVGFKIPSDFVVGYGLDYEGYYRNLPHIAQVQIN